MCFRDIPFTKPVSRFRLGRDAAENAKVVTQLIVSGKEFRSNEIAHHPPNEYLLFSDTPYQTFPSRQKAYGELYKALVNEDGHPILGIYGMPGVGKTQMMEQAWEQAMKKAIFDKVTRANVGSGELDVMKLQDDLAASLNCHFESNNKERRASQLKTSLMNGGKILVILDDVWGDIPLSSVGIPFADHGSYKGCKILLTSRSKDVCLRNKCEDPIEIDILTDDESWQMFENAVGSSKVKSLQDKLLAKKVCNECGALPLLINALGKALRFATEESWKDAQGNLESCQFDEIDGVDSRVYFGLRLSFEKLTEAVRTCLLLCSLFPEDADIEIKMLSDFATGSQLLGPERNIHGLVDILKSSSLLLYGKDNHTFKMHDTIRDVARSVAAKDPTYAFLFIRGCSWFPNIANCSNRKLIHLDLEGDNVRFPDDHLYPELHTVWLQCSNLNQQLSSDFFKAFMNLKVLLLKGMSISQQQLSIHTLNKLRVLILDNCDIHQKFLSSVSENLVTLCIWECDLPSPLGLPELKNLRKLELFRKPWGTIDMVPNAIARLSRLEELIIPYGFRSNDAIELSQLTCLRILTIDLLNDDPDEYFFSNLEHFNICVGRSRYKIFRCIEPPLGTESSISYRGRYLTGWVKALVQRAENVRVEGIEGLPNGFSETFANLKCLKLKMCNYMENLTRLPVDKFQPVFPNLTILRISSCNGLTYLFSASVVKCLVQLQKLQIKDCDVMEEVVRVDGPTDHGEEIINFPSLKSLELRNLSNIRSFCSRKGNAVDNIASSSVQVVHSLFGEMVSFPSVEALKIWGIPNAREIWGNDNSCFSQLKILGIHRCDKLENVVPVRMLHLFINLEHLRVFNCNSLKNVFPNSSIARDLVNLKEMIVFHCHAIREIIGEGDEEINDGLVLFPALTSVEFRDLPDLKSFWGYDPSLLEANSDQTQYFIPQQNFWWPAGRHSLINKTQSFQRLKELVIRSCGLSTLFRTYDLRSFQQLQELRVDDCPLLEEFVGEEDDETTPPASLPQFRKLILQYLPKLKNLGISTYMPALEYVEVDICRLISNLFTCSAFTNFQQLKELHVSNCRSLEEIVEDEMDDQTSENTISLQRLGTLELKHLPRLKCFSGSSSYAFNMPVLESIYMYGCPSMDKFTSLQVNIPLLKIHQEYTTVEDVSDLNVYIRQEVYGKSSYNNQDSETEEEEEDGGFPTLRNRLSRSLTICVSSP